VAGSTTALLTQDSSQRKSENNIY